MPTRAYLRALAVASQALLRTISKVAGAEIVQDAVAFFQAFQGMEEGFHDRAAAVRRLLADPSTAYVVVTSPRPDAVEEAAYFAGQAGRRPGSTPAALVVNRVHPRFGRRAARLPSVPPGSDLAALVENLERSSTRWPTASRPPTPSWSARWRRRRSAGSRCSAATSTTSTAWGPSPTISSRTRRRGRVQRPGGTRPGVG